MIAGRDFRHYAAEFFMLRSLRGHFAGEQLRAALAVSAAQDRHRGLVTRGFDRENCHKAVVIPMKLLKASRRDPSVRAGLAFSLGMTTIFWPRFSASFPACRSLHL